MIFRRQWIPPWALLVAQLAHGTSWVLLAIGAEHFGVRGLTPGAVAWIHVVALGWFTTAALAILLHVIPGFTDLHWRGETLARTSLAVFALGMVFFVAGWLLANALVIAGALTLSLGLCGYLAAALATLTHTDGLERAERAIARALLVTLLILATVAVLGGATLAALEGAAPSTWIAHLPQAHGMLGIFGWFTILIVGVAARTMRPICGVRSRYPRLHAIVGSSLVLGAPLLAVGLASAQALILWCGAALVALGCGLYLADAIDILRRATVPHRPPQAFVGAALLWLCVALVLGAGVLSGKPWGEALLFTLLVGWIGQMVNAHVLHIGVRAIATMVRGDEDETRPSALLDATRSWMMFGGMQVAVLLGVVGLLRGETDDVIAAGIVGAAAWLVTMTNLVGAYFSAFDGTKTSARPSMQ